MGAPYDRLPSGGIQVPEDTAYVHITSNETIQGVQFATEPDVGDVPLVCDASSDFLHRPLEIAKYGLIYACAQKNAGPAGVTVVIIRDDLLPRVQDDLPGASTTATMSNTTRSGTRRRRSRSTWSGWWPAGCRKRLAGWRRCTSSTAQSRVTVRRARRLRRLLRGPCAARLSLADERHLPPADGRIDEQFLSEAAERASRR